MGPDRGVPKPADAQLPPVVPPKDRQAEVADSRKKFGLDGPPAPPVVEHKDIAHKDVADPRTKTERALDAQLPGATANRAAYERSPVHELEKGLVQLGMPPDKVEAFRHELRDDPRLCATLGGANAELLRDFSRVGTVPFERYLPPKNPEVGALVHTALGKRPDEYVSQRDLDGLVKTVLDHKEDLLRKGIGETDVDRVRSYLIRETGRVPHTDLTSAQPVMTSDGQTHANAEEAIQHDRRRMIAVGVESPLSTAAAREAGADLATVEHVAHAATQLHDVMKAVARHTSKVRDGITAAETPVVGRTAPMADGRASGTGAAGP
jgi:hypothetical protein